MEAGFPRVTVVIPTHNRWRMLRSTLWSVLQQEGVDLRVVVVDDASEDDTPERLAAASDPRLEVLRLDGHAGVSRARNRGLEEVATEWVAFLDDDDVWEPGHLAAILDAIDGAERTGGPVDIAYSASLTIGADRRVKKPRPAPQPEDVPEGLLRSNAIGTPSGVVLRAAAVRAVGGFDTELSLTSDWDLWLRVARDGAIASSHAFSLGYTLHEHNMHLDTRIAVREMPVLEARYARGRRSRGAVFRKSCARWIAESYRTAGNRYRASYWYARTFQVERRPRDLLRAAGLPFGERAIEWSGLKRPTPPPPPTPAWLDAVAEVDRLPREIVPFGRPERVRPDRQSSGPGSECAAR